MSISILNNLRELVSKQRTGGYLPTVEYIDTLFKKDEVICLYAIYTIFRENNYQYSED